MGVYIPLPGYLSWHRVGRVGGVGLPSLTLQRADVDLAPLTPINRLPEQTTAREGCNSYTWKEL